jgi:hypothetical protein
MNASPIASDIALRYGQDGFYLAPDLLTPGECDTLKAEATRIMREHPKVNRTVYVGVSVVSSLYRDFAGDPRIVAILQQIMPDGIMFMSDKFVVKTATQRFATPWHVDAAYWPGTRPKISVWIPLDDATEANGTLVVVRGSHRKRFAHQHNDGKASNGEFNNVIAASQWPKDDEVVCNVRKGAAIFFSDQLVHGSCASTSGDDRCAIISTYHAPAPDDEFDKQFAARRVIIPAAS